MQTTYGVNDVSLEFLDGHNFHRTLREVAINNPFNETTHFPRVWSEDVLISLFRQYDTIREVLESKGINEKYIRKIVSKRFKEPYVIGDNDKNG